MKYQAPQPQSYSAETAALITQLKDRIKRLEEAGNEMHRYITVTRGLLPECTNNWRKAKEDKL